jgi:hypothetical protein
VRPPGLTFRLVHPDPETTTKTETTKPNAITRNLNVQLLMQLSDLLEVIVWSEPDWVVDFGAHFPASFLGC